MSRPILPDLGIQFQILEKSAFQYFYNYLATIFLFSGTVWVRKKYDILIVNIPSTINLRFQ
jgi:hypothetical protein